MPIGEAEILSNADRAVSVYREAYVKRYGVTPIDCPPASNQSKCKRFIGDLGLKRTISLLEHFLTMPDDWKKGGHSLSSFSYRIHEVQASYANKYVTRKHKGDVNLKECLTPSCESPVTGAKTSIGASEGYLEEGYCGSCSLARKDERNASKGQIK